jgi:hypothetical protein
VLSLSDIVNVKVGIGKGVFEAPGTTVIGGKKPSSNLEILKLFANGEQGFFYDPNDLSTMYKDAAGTVPVTDAGQPVGLMLDKSKGLVLGAERLQSPFSDISKWQLSAGFNILNGKLICDGTQTAITTANRTDGISFIPFRSHMVEVTLESYSGNPPTFRANTGIGFTLNKVGKNIGIVTTTANGVNFNILTIAGASFVISNISIKELKGNHAYQTTSAARPILQDAPRRIDFDAVDDKLITNLPTQLTGCTVIRSVPNVGTQILTGQTTPATYEDNTDHCGLIVINRALTTAETAQITQLFNKAAGV